MATSRIEPVGDAAILITLSDELDLEASRRARAVTRFLRAHPAEVAGLAVTPGHASVLVAFDPERAPDAAVRGLVERAVAESAAPDVASSSRLHRIAVRYGSDDGPDLAEVAARCGLSEREVVARHSRVEYTVLVLGFVPGFPYLGILPPELDLPRRATPRVRVAPGSVAIAGRQTCVYPRATPGGWHLIGRTDATLWDPTADAPARLAPGDRVRFEPV